MFVLDVDGPDRRPHPGKGLEALAELEDRHGPLPATLTQITGIRWAAPVLPPPTRQARQATLPKGLEYKDHGGYVVVAPSIHPDSREPYVRCDHPVAAPPRWLVDLIVERPRRAAAETSAFVDGFSARRSPTSYSAKHLVVQNSRPRTAGAASAAIPMVTVPAGCTPPRRPVFGHHPQRVPVRVLAEHAVRCHRGRKPEGLHQVPRLCGVEPRR